MLRSLSRESGSFGAYKTREFLDKVRPKSLTLTKGKVLELRGLEYIQNPLKPLAELRTELIKSGKQATIRGGKKDGYWEWDQEGFGKLLASAGFTVLQRNGTTFTVGCTQKSYDEFLSQHGLPQSAIRHLIVTTEHSDYRVTGGIGSYVKECEILYKGSAGVLILDTGTADVERLLKHRWIAAQYFLTEQRIDTVMHANYDTLGDLTWELLEIIVSLYPGLQTIESQEMLLNRTIEAKKIGLMPAHIKLITTCHGSSFHLAKAKRAVLEAENIHVAYREKFTLEESDIVIFPTRFLRESYRQTGVMNLDDPSRIIRRLPFNTARLPNGHDLENYRRLTYIGKTSTVKGFDLFLETLLYIDEHLPALKEKIEEVKIIVTSTQIDELHLQDMFRKVEAAYNTSMVSLGREDLLLALAEYSRDSLALLTYQGDNHPTAVLELLAVGHDFLAADAAGTPELIPQKYKQHNLTQPNPVSFAAAVDRAFSNVPERRRLITAARKDYLGEQKAINGQYTISKLASVPSMPALKRSKTMPIKVEIIDLGDRTLLTKTQESVKRQILVPASVTVAPLHTEMQSSTEVGAARIRLYAGDTLSPTALAEMQELMISDNSCRAVLAYEQVPTYENGKLLGNREFHPYAPELGSVFLQEKYSRRVVALTKGQVLGDEFTDWQICIDIACRRDNVRVVPKKLISLAEAPSYPCDDVLKNTVSFAKSFSALPLFDATILYAELKRFDDLYWGARLTNHLQDLYIRRDHPSITYNVSPTLLKIHGVYTRYTPRTVRRVASWTTRTVYRAAQSMKRTLHH